MTTNDHTPLAARIAREHHIAMVVEHEGTGPVRLGCSCGLVSTGAERLAHIVTVTEQAVRERIAQEIEGLTVASGATGTGAWSVGYRSAIEDAARIARGESDD